MKHTFYALKMIRRETGAVAGWHSTGSFPTEQFHNAKLYASKGNINRAISYHRWNNPKSFYRVEVVTFEAVEVPNAAD